MPPRSTTGCPSLDDAKAAYLIGRLDAEGASKLWRETSPYRRAQQALVAELDLCQSEHRRNLNRLEALLSRHWPELGRVAELNSASVLRLIARYGTTARVCRDRAQAESLLHHARRGMASPTTVAAFLHSARTRLGVAATPAEEHLLQVPAEELLLRATRPGRAHGSSSDRGTRPLHRDPRQRTRFRG